MPPNNNETSTLSSGNEDNVLQKEVIENVDRDERSNKRIKVDEAQHVVSSSSSPSTDSSCMLSSPIVDKNTTETVDANSASIQQCVQLLFLQLPSSLTNNHLPPNNNNNADETISTFRELWNVHGFRTSMVTSPRPAVSIYLDSCTSRHDVNEKEPSTISADNEVGRDYLLTCIGMHPSQLSIEHVYSSIIKNIYCMVLFLKRMRNVRQDDMNNEELKQIISSWEENVEKVLFNFDGKEPNITLMQELSDSSTRIISQVLSKLTDIDHTLRSDQLLHEYNRITFENCTLANACLQRWLNINNTDGNNNNNKQMYDLDEVYYKASPPGRYLPKYERITIYMKDPDAVEPKNHQKFIFLPSLTQILTSRAKNKDSNNGSQVGHVLDSVVNDMISTTWETLLRSGYYVDETRKGCLEPELKKFYLSGLLCGKEGNVPILL